MKEQCRHFMAENGLPLEGNLITDGLIHRYAGTQKNKKDEYYVAFEGSTSYGNPYLTCIFGSWRLGTKYEYKSFDQSKEYTYQERKDFETVLRQQRARIEVETELQYRKAAQKAHEIWDQLYDEPPSEEYLRYNKIKGLDYLETVRYGLCPQGLPSIVIPIHDMKNFLFSLQYISCDTQGQSFKTFLSGGKKKGNFHLLGNLSLHTQVIFVTEGFATGVSVHEPTQIPTAIAFDAGNIQEVVRSIRCYYPHVTIVIAGDDDAVGRKKAEQVAERYACFLTFPIFPRGLERKGYNDFNDLLAIAGPEAVRSQLRGWIE